MVYISANGSLTEHRSIFRASILSDLFWATVNGFGLLIQTIFMPVDPATRRPPAKKTTGVAPAFRKRPSPPNSRIKGMDSLKKQGDCKAAGG